MSKMDPAELAKQPDDVTECPYKLDRTIIKNTNKKTVRSGINFSLGL